VRVKEEDEVLSESSLEEDEDIQEIEEIDLDED
jgi:hypothetical protein